MKTTLTLFGAIIFWSILSTDFTVMAVPMDFGDAPTNYPTLLANDGARHRFSQLRLGTKLDYEADGQPSPAANGDDAAGVDDEDGVFFVTPLVPGTMAGVNVRVSGVHGRLDAWMDFNHNGVWEPSEKIFNGLAVSNGLNPLTFPVPTNTIYGPTYARFRLSSAGFLPPNGYANDGEVEDYLVQFVHSNSIPNLAASLSLSPPVMVDGNYSLATVYCTNSGGDIEKLIITNHLPSPFTKPTTNASAPFAYRIIARDSDGNPVTLQKNALWNYDAATSNYWSDLGSLPANCAISLMDTVQVDSASFNMLSSNNESLALPSRYDVTIFTGLTSFTNISGGGISITLTSNLTVKTKMDYGDAPDTYHTTSFSNGARHRVTPQLCLGHNVDAESDGIPTPLASSDDLIGTPDDEDGVGFTSAIAASGTATVTVIVTGNGKLDAWLDFNRNGVWDAGEQIFFSVPVTNGVNNLSFPVPAGAVSGASFARFRLSSAGGLGPVGYATDGEVEDYAVTIGGSGAPNLTATIVPSTTMTTCTSNMSFTVTVTNHGPSTANNILIGLLVPGFHITQNTGPGVFSATDDGELSMEDSLQQNAGVVITVNGFFDIFGEPFVSTQHTEVFNDFSVVDTTNVVTVSSDQPNSHPGGGISWNHVTVTNLLDYGDAPTHLSPWNYPTLFGDNGARHAKSTNHLGALIDYEPNGQPNLAATGDDTNGLPDEDSVNWSSLVRGTHGSVKVHPTANGYVNIWLDSNGDGDWADPGEHLVVDAYVPGGVDSILTFPIPAGGYTGPTYGRVRYSTVPGLNFNGFAKDGEVVDRQLALMAPVSAAGINLAPRGNATITVDNGSNLTSTATVSGLGTDGTDGVILRADDPCQPGNVPCEMTNPVMQKVEVDLGEQGSSSMDLSSDGSKLLVRARGYFGNSDSVAVLNSVRLWRQNGALTFDNLTPYASATPPMLRVQVFTSSNHVGTVMLNSTNIGVFVGTNNPDHLIVTAIGRPAIAIRFNGPMTFNIGSNSITGTTFRFSADQLATATANAALDTTGDSLLDGADDYADGFFRPNPTGIVFDAGDGVIVNNTLVQNENIAAFASGFEDVLITGYCPSGSFTVTKQYLGGQEIDLTAAWLHPLATITRQGNTLQINATGTLGAEYQLYTSSQGPYQFTALPAISTGFGGSFCPVGDPINYLGGQEVEFYRLQVNY